jgi:hypothetical protein
MTPLTKILSKKNVNQEKPLRAKFAKAFAVIEYIKHDSSFLQNVLSLWPLLQFGGQKALFNTCKKLRKCPFLNKASAIQEYRF